MLDPEAQITRAARELMPRTMVVVDGSEGGWNALAWAVGYAKARCVGGLEAILYTGSWHFVPAAGEAAAMMPAEFASAAQEASWRSVIESARDICCGSGVKVSFGSARCRSSRELVALAKRERPDLVVMGHIGCWPRTQTRMISTRLIRRGIAVAVIP